VSKKYRVRRSTKVAALAIGMAVVGAACANRADDGAASSTTASADTASSTVPDGGTDTTTDTSTDTTAAPETLRFGDLESPCGEGDAVIADGQNGGDRLVLATATDRGAAIAPGLTQEMYDTAVAFAAWCNEQGGIAGLEIEVFDADGKLFEVPSAIEQVCDRAFAMVGGGWAFDDLQFPRFHECGMIDVAGYTVSSAKAMSDAMVQPIPNPSNRKNAGWFSWAREVYPEQVARFATVYPDIPTTRVVEEQFVEEVLALGGYDVIDRIPYSATGEANWAPFVFRLQSAGITSLAFVGSPEQFVPFLRSAREVGFLPEVVLLEANLYSELLLDDGLAQGAIIRSYMTPFEEADRSAAMADFLAMMETYNPRGKIGGLGVQAASAYLLFATGARACIESNDGVLERSCVLDALSNVTGWTGGGLHSPTDPSRNEPPACYLLLEVVDDEFVRLFPEIGGDDDDGNGFHCDPASVVDLTGDYGDVSVGKDPTRSR
jgi:hypothetical protein